MRKEGALMVANRELSEKQKEKVEKGMMEWARKKDSVWSIAG